MNRIYMENLNQGRFETWSEKPDLKFLHVTQVHGTELAQPLGLPAEADGIIASWVQMNEPLAIKTADCLPVVIEGEKGVCFLHAGWRGLAAGILVKKEIQDLNPQRVFIGPSIHSCCFEVTEEFHQHFGPDHFSQRGGKQYFDLQEEARAQLRKLFPNLLVQIAPICTCCNEKFHSYRRDNTKSRNWNLYIKG